MFRGAAKVTLDVKGRMSLPTRVRDTLAQSGERRVVATVDRDQCVLLYPPADWQKLQDRLMDLPNLNPEARWLQRLMVGYATDLDIDGHGRVLIPGELRDFITDPPDLNLSPGSGKTNNVVVSGGLVLRF